MASLPAHDVRVHCGVCLNYGRVRLHADRVLRRASSANTSSQGRGVPCSSPPLFPRALREFTTCYHRALREYTIFNLRDTLFYRCMCALIACFTHALTAFSTVCFPTCYHRTLCEYTPGVFSGSEPSRGPGPTPSPSWIRPTSHAGLSLLRGEKVHRSRTPTRVVCTASLIAATDAWSVWAALCIAAASGSALGRTKLGLAASPPVCAMVSCTIDHP